METEALIRLTEKEELMGKLNHLKKNNLTEQQLKEAEIALFPPEDIDNIPTMALRFTWGIKELKRNLGSDFDPVNILRGR